MNMKNLRGSVIFSVVLFNAGPVNAEPVKWSAKFDSLSRFVSSSSWGLWGLSYIIYYWEEERSSILWPSIGLVTMIFALKGIKNNWFVVKGDWKDINF